MGEERAPLRDTNRAEGLEVLVDLIVQMHAHAKPFGRWRVVDDDTTLLEDLERILTPHDAVHTTASGPAARALIQRDDRWEAILTDRGMPGFGGAEWRPRVNTPDPRSRQPGLKTKG